MKQRINLMSLKIYTKTGDTGETSLFGGKRLSKDDIRIEAYGTVDELNACIGLLRDHPEPGAHDKVLFYVQNPVFTIGSMLATDPDHESPVKDLDEGDVMALEGAMDGMTESIPPLRNFILPGGHPAVSSCHLARTVSRRAERRIVALASSSHVDPLVIKYINRLADYFFILARWIAHQNGIEEIKWEARK
jgi:cob(I)alamin adenosyltransferase